MELVPVSQELENLEKIIDDGLQSFVAVGNALLQVRNDQLYKERGFTRFEDYCQERWGMTHPHANRTIKAAEVAGYLPNLASDMNEAQAIQLSPILTKLGAAKVTEVWEEVQQESSKEKEPVTAKLIRRVVQRWLPKPKLDPYIQDGITPDTLDEVHWGRGITANQLTDNTVAQIIRVTECLQDLPSEDFRYVARPGDIERWREQLKEAVKAINKCLSMSKD